MSINIIAYTYYKWDLNSYLKRNTARARYEEHSFRKIIGVYREAHTKHINTGCGEIQNLLL